MRLTLTKRLKRVPERFFEDVEAAGRLALVRAVDQFDPARGVGFATYAISLIRGAVLEWLRREDWVPRSVREAEKSGEKVLVFQQVSLEAIVYGDGSNEDLTRLDTLSDWEDTPDMIVCDRIEAEVIHTLVRCLPWRQRRVVELYYWDRHPFHRIAQRLKLSESRSKQIHDIALVNLRLLCRGRGEIHAGS